MQRPKSQTRAKKKIPDKILRLENESMTRETSVDKVEFWWQIFSSQKMTSSIREAVPCCPPARYDAGGTRDVHVPCHTSVQPACHRTQGLVEQRARSVIDFSLLQPDVRGRQFFPYCGDFRRRIGD